ncbi:MAG TPA: N-acetylmuramic acid 6-phosphate etherase [Chthoniobacteraceae bacterium]|jgi:N-acetylmuramic acid 6-phosphate etherase|nr:N-acetylmuramic acid 6-phosphate etherase [Chthoniobacteraceae bacterium]
MSQTAADHTPDSTEAKRVLGIEGGGTKTEWVLARPTAEGGWRVLQSGMLAASNMKLATDAQLAALFSVLPGDATHVGVYLAGCATEVERARLQRLAAERWPAAHLALGSDRDSAMAASFHQRDGIVVIAGTGAAVHGRYQGRQEKAGGWGQLLGDRGSGYYVAMQGLRCVLSSYDIEGRPSPMAKSVLRRLALNRLSDLVDWASAADKLSVARLAPAVFDAAHAGDAEMLEILLDGAKILAEFTAAVARRLGKLDLPVKLFGGLFEHHPEYRTMYAERLRRVLPAASVEFCGESGALGAAWLAAGQPETAPRQELRAAVPDAAELAVATTEQRNPRSEEMDKLPTARLVRLFIDEEDYVADALRSSEEAVACAVDLVAAALRKGGRLFYIGAGTSGRLGVLDASEIPPTFGAPPELVQGIIAGGALALHSAVEGAEDQPAAGALAVIERGVSAADVVCGIAASGRTPFVLGGLAEACRLGAGTVLLTCNPARRRDGQSWDVEIDLATGPELVTGSTRLKAGTATKLVLNILSTCAMIRMGKVRGNLMINVRISNEKLRLRGIRLVAEVLQVSEEKAAVWLEEAGWDVPACLGGVSADAGATSSPRP